jgi:cell division protein FtsN
VNTSATTVTAATTTSNSVVNKQLAALSRTQPIAAKTTSAKQIVQMPVRKEGNFVVQVASFKARQDAEHMKGLLILKGFEVTVVPVVMPNQGNWFRVIIGPYPNRVLALKAQNILARTQRIKGMVRSA